MSGEESIQERLLGTTLGTFQIGIGGPQWDATDGSGNFNAKNVTNTSFVNVRVADPVVVNDAVNKEYADAKYPSVLIDVPSPGSYTITGTIGVPVVEPSGALFCAKPNISNAQMDTALISGGSFPSTGWFVELSCNNIPIDWNADYPGIGVCVATGTTSSDTAYTFIRFWQNTSNGILPSLQGQHSHPGAGIVGGALNPQVNDFSVDKLGSAWWPRLFSDGTNLYYQVTYDGYWWLNWFTETLPASIAFWGFCIGNASGSGTTGRLATSIRRNKLHSTLTVPQTAVTAIANTTPIQVTSPNHGANTGDIVSYHGTGVATVNTGTGASLLNLWVVKVVDANNVQLEGSTAAGAAGAGGTMTVLSR